MTLPITEELLQQLGFVQQQPPHIWDYSVGNDLSYFRFSKANYGDQDQWTFFYRGGSGMLVQHLMTVLWAISMIAHQKGIEETQDKLYETLGLTRLADLVADRLRD